MTDTKNYDRDWQRVMINSAYRKIQTDPTHNFTYNLKRTVERVSEIKVASVQIPFTYYTVKSSNNLLVIQEIDGTHDLLAGVVPKGLYDAAGLVAALKTVLNSLTGRTLTYDVTYDTTTMHLTISAGGAFSIDLLTTNNIASTLGFTLTTGFLNGQESDTALVFDSNGQLYVKGSSNNVIYLSEVKLGGTPLQAVLTPGNYTTTTFLAELKTQLNAVSSIASSYTIVTYSKNTLRLTIGNASLQFAIILTGPNNAAPMLGYTTTQILASTHIGDTILNISGTNTVIVKSSKIAASCSSNTVYADGFPDKNILHTVTVASLPGDYIIEQPVHVSYVLNKQTDFKDGIDFYLEDENGDLLDLNGAQWSVQLLFRVKAK